MKRRRSRHRTRSLAIRNPSLDLADLGSWAVIIVGSYVVVNIVTAAIPGILGFVILVGGTYVLATVVHNALVK